MRGRPRHKDILTPREWEVLSLVAEGLTNEEIADRLSISFGAAKYHVGEILSKLGVSSRQEAVAVLNQRRVSQSRLPLLTARGPFITASTLVLGSLLLAGYVFWNRSALDSVERTVPVASFDNLDSSQSQDTEVANLVRSVDLPRTILFSPEDPINLGDAAEVIKGLPRVKTLGELERSLSDQINLIVVDRSAGMDPSMQAFLELQLSSGRAILELNTCFAGLHSLSNSQSQSGEVLSQVTETSPSGVSFTSSTTSVCSIALSYEANNVPYFGFRRADSSGENTSITSSTSRQNIGQLKQGLIRVIATVLDANAGADVRRDACRVANEMQRTEAANILCQ